MKAKWSLMLFGVVLVLSLVTIQGCGGFAFFSPTGHLIPNLLCQDAHVTVLPGHSKPLADPCPFFPGGPISGDWNPTGSAILEQDFVTGDCTEPFLPGAVNGITVTSHFGDRFLVADLATQPKVDFPVCYLYDNRRPGGERNVGGGILFVTTAAMTVSATANPTTVQAGTTSQLNAMVTGGVPPYSFEWSPTASLSNRTLANPVAKPSMTTTYTVVVFDSTFRNTASATTTVTVGSSAGFKVGVQIPFDTPDAQVSVTVGTNVCLATNKTTCTQLVPGGTQVLLKVVKFPANTTKLFDWNNVTCDINRTPTSCTFTVTKDTSVVPVFL